MSTQYFQVDLCIDVLALLFEFDLTVAVREVGDHLPLHVGEFMQPHSQLKSAKYLTMLVIEFISPFDFSLNWSLYLELKERYAWAFFVPVFLIDRKFLRYWVYDTIIVVWSDIVIARPFLRYQLCFIETYKHSRSFEDLVS